MRKIKFKNIKVGDCIVEDTTDWYGELPSEWDAETKKRWIDKRYLVFKVEEINRKTKEVKTECFIWLNKKFKCVQVFGKGHTSLTGRDKKLFKFSEEEIEKYYNLNVVLGSLRKGCL